jgi:predicted metal-dependent phosphoesterase TrpH
MLQDLHLHTFVSDGELDPVALLRLARSCGITHLSITDHDALGAYAWEGGAVFPEAERLGLSLAVGIELDADLDGHEVHLLGFELSLDDVRLGEHLTAVRETRAERARREIELVNAQLGAGSVSETDIFVPGRETLMRPHFIHPLLRKGLFDTYEDANGWYRKNIKAGVAVPKPPFEEAIGLIHGAGGWSCLAHPGYYAKDGFPVAERLPILRGLGLDGVELEYPYHTCSPHRFSADEERTFVDEVRRVGEAVGLRFTRGTDCHTKNDFERRYAPEAPRAE